MSNARGARDLDDIAVARALADDGITLRQINPAEQLEVVRRLTEKCESIAAIADRLTTSIATVSRRRAMLVHRPLPATI